MQISRLTLTQFRAFEQVALDFYPGMNLLIGINGVGKSSILDALRVMLSQVVPRLTAAKKQELHFQSSDITVGRNLLTAELQFYLGNSAFNYLVQETIDEYSQSVITKKKEEQYSNQVGRRDRIRRRREQQEIYDSGERYQLTPNDASLLRSLKRSKLQPVAVYFSTRRSIADFKKHSRASGQAAAFVDGLDHRGLRLLDIADWWIAQRALAEESSLAQKHFNQLGVAVNNFLHTCVNLDAKRETNTYEYQDKTGNSRTVQETETNFLFNKAGVTLDVRQLSDGERGVLALVLDLARRLIQANPELDNPLKDGKAIVLIDELDLHLHPIWQRTIVKDLTTTFPNCQFIATTHSPLVVGEVKPPGLSLIVQENNQIAVLQKGIQGYGLASNWILEHLMGATSRNASTQAQINLVEDALEEGDLELARSQLEQLKTMIQCDDDEVIRLEASINNLEALAEDVDLDDEMDSEEE
jgi:predicted ATP-binding protein involved in virulence